MTLKLSDLIDVSKMPPVLMSNLDHSVDWSVAEHMRVDPELVALHTAWEFCGHVRFTDEKWVEQVMRYHSHVDTVEAGSPEELMEAVNERWGWA